MRLIATITKRAWLPLVVALAAVAGSMAVLNLRGAFGSDAIFHWDGSGSQPIASINEKQVIYEVFGPDTSTGRISYLDDGAQPRRAMFARLPWSFTITTTSPVVIGNVVAQGDGDRIGCRITVNGSVHDEHVAVGRHAQAFCLVKAA